MTPGYMVREKVGRELMRGRAGKRAWNLERRLEEGRGGLVARRCWKEMKERWRRGKVLGSWEQERWEFLRERGMWEGEKERVEYEEIEKKDRKMQDKERETKIGESRYNR